MFRWAFCPYIILILLSIMEFKIHKNINQCRRLWNELSPNGSLFDVWDFRQCFYNRQDNEPYFLVARNGIEILGLIPLDFIKSKNEYSYFGGWFPERNSFFLKDKNKIAELLDKCPANTCIEGISHDEGKYFSFSEDEFTYYLDISKYDYNFEKYFDSFDKKRRKNFKRDIKNIPKYKVHINRLKDFKRLVDLNIKQFDEESIFNDRTTKDSVYKMMNLARKKGFLQMLSIEVKGKVEAVDVGILFGKWYHVITGSSNNQKIPNIGKLMTILDIKNAINKKARYVDFLASAGYWKSQWNFDREMLFKFLK